MSNNEFGNPTPNPYQGATPTPVLPGETKPTSVTVFGIINIVYGIMGLCNVAAMTVQMVVMRNGQGAVDNPILELTNSPVYQNYTMVQMGLTTLATIILLISGFGLLAGKPYGRTLSIVWSIISIIMGIVGLVFIALFVISPLMEQASTMPDGPEKMGVVFGTAGAGIGGVCGLIYPIVLLIFMMRTPVVNYMRSRQGV